LPQICRFLVGTGELKVGSTVLLRQGLYAFCYRTHHFVRSGGQLGDNGQDGSCASAYYQSLKKLKPGFNSPLEFEEQRVNLFVCFARKTTLIDRLHGLCIKELDAFWDQFPFAREYRPG